MANPMLESSNLNEIYTRLDKLTPESKAIWGKMNVNQMLAHCDKAINLSLNKKPMKQHFIGILFGKKLKNKWLGNEDSFPKNSPTHKNLIIKNPDKFTDEKGKLKSTIATFNQKGMELTKDKTHPFFGKLTQEEWKRLVTKHLDHHFRQFGV